MFGRERLRVDVAARGRVGEFLAPFAWRLPRGVDAQKVWGIYEKVGGIYEKVGGIYENVGRIYAPVVPVVQLLFP